jgi:hypothetical protein
MRLKFFRNFFRRHSINIQHLCCNIKGLFTFFVEKICGYFLAFLAGSGFAFGGRPNAKRGLMGGGRDVLVGAVFGSGEKQYQPNNGTNRDKAESHQQYRVHKYSLIKMYSASRKPAIQQSSAMIRQAATQV